MNLNASKRPLPPSAFRNRLLFLGGLGVVAVAGMFWHAPIPQDEMYHDFADQRPLLAIPNFLNVASNIPFVFAGILGLVFVLFQRKSETFERPEERGSYLLLFAGVFLTGFGSAYYHWQPSSERLVWDRLPMTIAFMSLFAVTIAERINVRLGTFLLLPLLATGVASIDYWQWTGDLRTYILVQFYPLVTIPLMLLLFPSRYSGTKDIFIVLGWYLLAKTFEEADKIIYSVGNVVSGHTLKHLAAATGALWLLRMLKRRHTIAGKYDAG